MAAERVKKLRDLIDMLERLPSSPDRDRVLSEVRSRAVDVDTGVQPRAMLPVREPAPPLTVARAPKVERAPRRRPAAPAHAPARPVVAPPSPHVPTSLGDLLSLEDAPLSRVWAQDDEVVRPWTLGLRG